MDLLELAKELAPLVVGYAAIRADLAAARMRAEQAKEDAAKAHERLDDHINLHHVKGA